MAPYAVTPDFHYDHHVLYKRIYKVIIRCKNIYTPQIKTTILFCTMQGRRNWGEGAERAMAFLLFCKAKLYVVLDFKISIIAHPADTSSLIKIGP